MILRLFELSEVQEHDSGEVGCRQKAIRSVGQVAIMSNTWLQGLYAGDQWLIWRGITRIRESFPRQPLPELESLSDIDLTDFP